MLAASPNLVMVLHRDAAVGEEDGAVTLRKLTLPLPGPAAALALRRLADGGLTQAQFDGAYCDDGGGDFIACIGLRYRLAAAGFLDYRLDIAGIEMARLVWLIGGEPLDERPIDRNEVHRMSRFALMRRLDDRLIVESPLGRARVELAPAAADVLVGLVEGATLPAIEARWPQFADRGGEILVSLLRNARVLVDNTVDGNTEDEAPLGWWEFHDAVFHSRSRLGRHALPYGGTFHRRGRDAPPSLLRHETGSGGEESIPLFKPDLESCVRNDPPFGAVLEARRSIRDYGDEPLTIEQLGEFLFRTARVQQVIKTPDDDLDYSFRPHPAGGAIHELTSYPVIGACRGLPRGLYRYDPLRHALSPLPVSATDLDRLLELAWITADRKSSPQVYFAITAWFARLQWKYQSMVYAVILKNVGALYQTMYLTATAMGLAPCALGGGDSQFFAKVAGFDSHAETTVGEFMLGSRPITHE